jgi:hypothetical protein
VIIIGAERFGEDGAAAHATIEFAEFPAGIEITRVLLYGCRSTKRWRPLWFANRLFEF